MGPLEPRSDLGARSFANNPLLCSSSPLGGCCLLGEGDSDVLHRFLRRSASLESISLPSSAHLL